MPKTHHSHKGPQARREDLNDLPLLSQSKDELEDTLDAIGEPIYRALLAAARAGKDQIIDVVAIILHRAGQPDRLAFCTCEHGDGEFLQMEKDTMRGIRQVLDLGESVSMRRYKVEFSSTPWTEEEPA